MKCEQQAMEMLERSGLVDVARMRAHPLVANLAALIEERDRLRSALQSYAPSAQYVSHLVNDGDGHFDEMGLDILLDRGLTARRALGVREDGDPQ